MKTVFILNPCAGKKNNVGQLCDKIRKVSEDIEIYITKAVGDVTDFVRNYCENNGPARFIACGGDGTFNEVLNGVIGVDNAEIGIIPMGTGNDFCRNFDEAAFFEDIVCQSSGEIVKCDAIKYTTETPRGIVSGYCANMFNIGFDCNVADMTASIKTKPFISGSMAYLISIFTTLIKKKGANLKIEVDGKKLHNGKLLLTSIANGCYCGGGIKSNPLASICDGSININVIKNISRLKFLSLLPRYMNGSFLSIKNIDKIIKSIKCSKITLMPLDGNMRLCIDGEIIDAGKPLFEICPSTFNFVVPKSAKDVEQKETIKL